MDINRQETHSSYLIIQYTYLIIVFLKLVKLNTNVKQLNKIYNKSIKIIFIIQKNIIGDNIFTIIWFILSFFFRKIGKKNACLCQFYLYINFFFIKRYFVILLIKNLFF